MKGQKEKEKLQLKSLAIHVLRRVILEPLSQRDQDYLTKKYLAPEQTLSEKTVYFFYSMPFSIIVHTMFH